MVKRKRYDLQYNHLPLVWRHFWLFSQLRHLARLRGLWIRQRIRISKRSQNLHGELRSRRESRSDFLRVHSWKSALGRRTEFSGRLRPFLPHVSCSTLWSTRRLKISTETHPKLRPIATIFFPKATKLLILGQSLANPSLHWAPKPRTRRFRSEIRINSMVGGSDVCARRDVGKKESFTSEIDADTKNLWINIIQHFHYQSS